MLAQNVGVDMMLPCIVEQFSVCQFRPVSRRLLLKGPGDVSFSVYMAKLSCLWHQVLAFLNGQAHALVAHGSSVGTHTSWKRGGHLFEIEHDNTYAVLRRLIQLLCTVWQGSSVEWGTYVFSE